MENVKKTHLEVDCNVVHLAEKKQKMTLVLKAKLRPNSPEKKLKRDLKTRGERRQ